jgi:hypothetical protein
VAGKIGVSAVLLLAIGLLVGTACSSEPKNETGRVRGRLVLEGGFTDRIDPVDGVVTIERDHGRTIRIRARRVGGFSATVPVGTVELTGATRHFDGGATRCAAPDPVEIRSGATATTDVVCFLR